MQFLLGTLLLTAPLALIAQAEDETQQSGAEQQEMAEEEPEEEEIQTRMSFEIFKINKEVLLKAVVRQKKGAKFNPLPGQVVSFYQEDGTLLGKDTTQFKGIAEIRIKSDDRQSDHITYKAKLEPGKQVPEEIEEEAELMPSTMTLTLTEEDAVKTMTVFVGRPTKDGKVQPLAEKECKVYVKRLFGNLPLSEDVLTTDEDGLASLEIPDDIKGDTAGNIQLIAKIEDDEDLGNVEANQVINWGLKLGKSDFYSERELWSARSNAPIPLIIVVNAMLIAIWGLMFYVMYKVYQIHKMGKKMNEST